MFIFPPFNNFLNQTFHPTPAVYGADEQTFVFLYCPISAYRIYNRDRGSVRPTTFRLSENA
jgi:hypothetical protein